MRFESSVVPLREPQISLSSYFLWCEEPSFLRYITPLLALTGYFSTRVFRTFPLQYHYRFHFLNSERETCPVTAFRHPIIANRVPTFKYFQVLDNLYPESCLWRQYYIHWPVHQLLPLLFTIIRLTASARMDVW